MRQVPTALSNPVPPRSGFGRRMPIPIVVGVVAALLLFGFGPNFDLALLAFAVFVAGWALLWRPGESAALVATFSLHWLAASIAVFHANWLGIDIFYYSFFGGDMRTATTLSLLGVLFLAVGMRIGAGAWRPQDAEGARRIALSYSVQRWFIAYLAASAASMLALALVWISPGLSQIMLAAAASRWAFYFTLAYASFARGGIVGPYLPLAFFAELTLSVGGYFSEFRTVFLVTIFAAVASGLRLNARMQASLAVLIAALLCFSVVWTSVKTDYRQFVSEGRKEQVISVDYPTRIAKLADLTAALDAAALEAGVDQLIRRLSYVTFLSVVIDFVPRYAPHEDGALLADAVSRPFLPRAFFPGKSVIDDTARTNIYTGGLASNAEGTSISLGYIAEVYIDFGVWGMMPALLAIGWAYGLAYRTLSRSRTAGPLLGMGLASFVLLSVGFLDSSITKVGGGFVVSLLVAWLIPKSLGWISMRWMTAPGRPR